MKRTMFGALTILVLALVINIPVVNAQSKTRADVPFAFTVSRTSLPAGTYTISEVSGGDMQVRNIQTNATVFVIAQREESLKQQNPRLVFHKYGERYFLAEAWSGSGTGIEFPAGKLEQELRATVEDTSAPQEVMVAMR